jgi:hypothetical protein
MPFIDSRVLTALPLYVGKHLKKKSTINCIQVVGVGAGVEDKMFNPSRKEKKTVIC